MECTDKQHHSNLTCHYCDKKWHIKHNCPKREKDKAKEEKEEDSSLESGEDSEGSDSEKVVNVAVRVPSDAAHVYL